MSISERVPQSRSSDPRARPAPTRGSSVPTAPSRTTGGRRRAAPGSARTPARSCRRRSRPWFLRLGRRARSVLGVAVAASAQPAYGSRGGRAARGRQRQRHRPRRGGQPADGLAADEREPDAAAGLEQRVARLGRMAGVEQRDPVVGGDADQGRRRALDDAAPEIADRHVRGQAGHREERRRLRADQRDAAQLVGHLGGGDRAAADDGLAGDAAPALDRAQRRR